MRVVKNLNTETDLSEQTLQTLIRLLIEQSDQGLPGLPFNQIYVSFDSITTV